MTLSLKYASYSACSSIPTSFTRPYLTKLVRVSCPFTAFNLTVLQATELPLSTFSPLSMVQFPLSTYCTIVKLTLNFLVTLNWV